MLSPAASTDTLAGSLSPLAGTVACNAWVEGNSPEGGDQQVADVIEEFTAPMLNAGVSGAKVTFTVQEVVLVAPSALTVAVQVLPVLRVNSA